MIESITDDYFPSPVRSALLKVVTLRYSIIVVAGAAGPLRTVRDFTVDGKRASIKSLQNDLFVRGGLRICQDRMEK